MAASLRIIADIVMPGVSPTDLPWWDLRYQHTALIRSKLMEWYAPASIKLRLSALRGVLKQCWLLGRLSAEDYERAVQLERVKGETLPKGRALSSAEIAAWKRVAAPCC